jgi:hypothetical protein
MDAKEKIRQEIRTALRAKDEWLLISLSRKGAGAISISSDTVWHGSEDDPRELRGPRWRTLASALEFSDIGYKWIVAGELSACVLKQQLLNNNVPREVIMHASAVERWAPECAKIKPACIQGFLNPTLPENKSRAAHRPGRATRKRMKSDVCALCGSTKDITLHHLIDRKFGGATEEENLLSVCNTCHDGIHAGKIDILDKVHQVWLKRFEYLIKQIRSQHIG